MTETNIEATAQRPFNILIVCTGNICRSPFVASVLHKKLNIVRPGKFSITSAGTRAVVGAPVDPSTRALLDKYDISSDQFRARQATETIMLNQNLILTMTRSHRAQVVEISPAVVTRTFTLDEFSRSILMMPMINEEQTRDRWQHAVRIAMRSRRQVQQAELNEIKDPYKLSAEAFDFMEAQVMPHVSHLLNWERQH